jgi:hypothetical protein
MTRYVLEILDGDQAGETKLLGTDKLVLGRKQDCGFVIHDEKCSGHHAEVRFEDGRYVLQDLGSTNGTMLDGRRVREVALSPFDIFQAGRIRVQFKEEGADVDAVQIGRFDQTRLRAGGRRRGGLLVLVLGVVIVAGGGAAAYFSFVAPKDGPGPRAARSLKVSGNLLADGADDFETDGPWNLQADTTAAPFDVTVNRTRAHSGASALAARAGRSEDGRPQRFALARLVDTHQVGSGTPMRLAAHLRTEGNGRGAIRFVFTSSIDESTLRTGSVPSSFEAYTRVEILARVPAGMDKVGVELLALLPDDDAEVFVDDVALVLDRTADVASLERSCGGRTLSGAGASFRVLGPTEATLLGVAPLVESPTLVALGAAGLLALSDAGLSLAVEGLAEAKADSQGFGIAFTPSDGGGATGLRLELPVESASVLVRTGAGSPFVGVSPEFEQTAAEVLLGTDQGRALLRFSNAVAVRGRLGTQSYRLELPATFAFDLQVRFEGESRAARDELRAATAARSAGQLAEVLDRAQRVLAETPHDLDPVRAAQALRAELLSELNDRVGELRARAAEARFFDSRDGYAQVDAAIDALLAKYGERHVRQIDELRQVQADVRAGVAALDRRAAEEHAQKLALLRDALDDGGQEALAELVGDYSRRRYPNGAATEAK